MLRKDITYGTNVSPALAHLFEWAGDQDQDPNLLLGNSSRVFNVLFSEHVVPDGAGFWAMWPFAAGRPGSAKPWQASPSA